MVQDSTAGQQEPFAPPTDAEVDSLIAGQDGSGSQTDATRDSATDRLNGLMRLVGHRTTERDSEKARADAAEAALTDAKHRLAMYEQGLDDDEDGALQAEAEQPEDTSFGDEREPDGSTQQDESAYTAGQDYWVPRWMQQAGVYVDPNAASRANSVSPNGLSEAGRLRAEFNANLGAALEQWGVEGKES